jgi:hypothetical protein
MIIDKDTTAAVVVNRNWANLHGVRIFLREHDHPEREIRGDDSHIVFAKVLDHDDPKGLWIELNTAKHREDSTVKRRSFLIPWSQVVTVVVGEEFSPAIRDEVRKMGFDA